MWFRVGMTQRSSTLFGSDEFRMANAFTLNGSHGVSVDFEDGVQHRVGNVVAKAFLRVGRKTVLALGAAALVQTLGCTVIIDADRKQCKVDADCTNRGEPFANTVCINSMCENAPSALWGCMNEEPPEPLPPATYNVTFHAQSIANTMPIAGVPAKLCRKINPACPEPEATGVTDANGDVTFQIPSNLAAFVAFDKFDETLPQEKWGDEWVPANYFINPNVTSDMTIAVQMATFQLLNILTLLVEKPQEPDRGTVLINVLSCTGAGAPGVVYKADRADDLTIPFYVEGSVPNALRTSTNTDGFGGFINLPPGIVAVSGEVEENGRLIDTTSVTVFANTITYSRLVARAKPPIPQ